MHIHTDEIAAAHTDYLKQHTALSVKQLLDSYKCGLVLLVLPLCFLLYPLSCLPGTLQWKARGLCVKTGQVDLIMFILSYTLLLQPPLHCEVYKCMCAIWTLLLPQQSGQPTWGVSCFVC